MTTLWMPALGQSQPAGLDGPADAFKQRDLQTSAAAPATRFRIESEQNIYEPDSGPWSGGHAPTIMQTTDGTILAGWRRDNDRVPNNEAWMSTLQDGRWTQPRILATGSESGDDYTLEKHGSLVIAPEEAPALLDAALFMDANECRTVIPAARDVTGRSKEEILKNLDAAAAEFSQNVRTKFKREGEW